jgi:hypothetical protein
MTRFSKSCHLSSNQNGFYRQWHELPKLDNHVISSQKSCHLRSRWHDRWHKFRKNVIYHPIILNVIYHPSIIILHPYDYYIYDYYIYDYYIYYNVLTSCLASVQKHFCNLNYTDDHPSSETHITIASAWQCIHLNLYDWGRLKHSCIYIYIYIHIYKCT